MTRDEVVRFGVSFLGGTLVVLTMLVVGLRFFHERDDSRDAAFESFEVEYLTPEEAARLLGERTDRHRLPHMIAAPPAPDDN